MTWRVPSIFNVMSLESYPGAITIDARGLRAFADSRIKGALTLMTSAPHLKSRFCWRQSTYTLWLLIAATYGTQDPSISTWLYVYHQAPDHPTSSAEMTQSEFKSTRTSSSNSSP